jgi:hypothetical protein
VIEKNEQGKRLGIWIMPDNVERGMMETFMTFLVPEQQQDVWQLAQSSSHQARGLGAQFREVHRDKATIFTWLAWQDPPGQSLGTALVQRALDPHAPYAGRFVAWFRQLYGL